MQQPGTLALQPGVRALRGRQRPAGSASTRWRTARQSAIGKPLTSSMEIGL
jgi:hypothetical protein